MLQRSILLLLVLALFESSCRKPDQFPNEPVIVFKDIYSTKDTLGYDIKMTVLLSFTDGDGDIGYKDIGQNGAIYDVSTSPYYDNYVATLFKLSGGIWIEQHTISPLGGRLPYLTPAEKNKTLKGDISCDVDVPLGSPGEIFRLEIFIYDRALHKSNIVTSSEIFLRTH